MVSEEEDARVARLSFLDLVAVSLVSHADLCTEGTTTDTPEVDVDARSILGRWLEVGVVTVESGWARSPLPKERFENLLLRGYSVPPICWSKVVRFGGTSRPWALARLIDVH